MDDTSSNSSNASMFTTSEDSNKLLKSAKEFIESAGDSDAPKRRFIKRLDSVNLDHLDYQPFARDETVPLGQFLTEVKNMGDAMLGVVHLCENPDDKDACIYGTSKFHMWLTLVNMMRHVETYLPLDEARMRIVVSSTHVHFKISGGTMPDDSMDAITATRNIVKALGGTIEWENAPSPFRSLGETNVMATLGINLGERPTEHTGDGDHPTAPWSWKRLWLRKRMRRRI